MEADFYKDRTENRYVDSLSADSIQLEIMTKRYNFVVDLLDEDQQRALRQWYIDTGVVQE